MNTRPWSFLLRRSKNLTTSADPARQSLNASGLLGVVPPGRYHVLAYTAVGDVPSEPALCTVVVEGAPTPPPPGPSPTPPAPNPNPPGPNPTPPAPSPKPPSDPLVQALQAAYVADADPNKAKSLRALAAL